MTRQAKDTVLFRQREYVLYDTEDGKLIYDCFKTIGEPVDRYWGNGSTCLWRQHLERYEIVDNQLWGQMIKSILSEKENRYDYEYSELKLLPYTGACVIGTQTSPDDFLWAYILGKEAYELHFTEGKLDECIDLKEAIDFYHDRFLKSEFYKQSKDQSKLHYKYDHAIAFHYLKYKYHPGMSVCMRFSENTSIWPVSEERKKLEYQKREYEYQDLLTKIK